MAFPSPNDKAFIDRMVRELDDYVLEFQRMSAIEEALEALGIERVYINHYRCEYCGTEWEDQWSCACDDECPGCGRDISPYSFEIVGEDNGA